MTLHALIYTALIAVAIHQYYQQMRLRVAIQQALAELCQREHYPNPDNKCEACTAASILAPAIGWHKPKLGRPQDLVEGQPRRVGDFM